MRVIALDSIQSWSLCFFPAIFHPKVRLQIENWRVPFRFAMGVDRDVFGLKPELLTEKPV